MASMTSPEQGAQQEWSRTFFLFSGKTSRGRWVCVVVSESIEAILIANDGIPKPGNRVAFRHEGIAGYARLFGALEAQGMLLLAEYPVGVGDPGRQVGGNQADFGRQMQQGDIYQVIEQRGEFGRPD